MFQNVPECSGEESKNAGEGCVIVEHLLSMWEEKGDLVSYLLNYGGDCRVAPGFATGSANYVKYPAQPVSF